MSAKMVRMRGNMDLLRLLQCYPGLHGNVVYPVAAQEYSLVLSDVACSIGGAFTSPDFLLSLRSIGGDITSPPFIVSCQNNTSLQKRLPFCEQQ